jgi:hypothetical protein
MDAIDIREEVLSWMKNVPKINGCAIPSSGERGTVTGLMNSALRLGNGMEESNMRRRQVLAWIFRDLLGKPMDGGISAKELTDEMWWALIKWTDAHKSQDDGSWSAHDGFNEEMVKCLRAMESWEHEMNKQLGFLEELDGYNKP